MGKILAKSSAILRAVVMGGFLTLFSAQAQGWLQTSAPSNYWSSVACSGDGNFIVAVITNYVGSIVPSIYISTNGGVNWFATNSTPRAAWTSIASSKNGERLVLASTYGSIFLSTNFGNSVTVCTSAPQNMYWGSVASSADGTKLLAAGMDGYGSNGRIYNTTNGGATAWHTNAIPNYFWTGVCISSNGEVMAAVNTNGYVFVCTNSAATWYSNFFSIVLPRGSVACSADGSKMMLCAYGVPIYISTNYGVNWNQTATPPAQWTRIVCSYNGQRIIALANEGIISSSIDGGLNWNFISNPYQHWVGAAVSADASKLVAISANSVAGNRYFLYGYVYTYATPASPALSIVTSSGNAFVTWPWPSTDFVLQQSSNPFSPNWIALTNVPSIVNQVILPATNNANFYRLAAP